MTDAPVLGGGEAGTQEWATVLLEVEREQTRSRLSALAAEFEGIVATSQGANGDDEHDPEGATIAFERERAAALRAQAEAHVGDVERALARVATGKYGICRSCLGPIAPERLRAVLVTELCIACAGGYRSPIASPSSTGLLVAPLAGPNQA
jgi:DnaK suppressor protein